MANTSELRTDVADPEKVREEAKAKRNAFFDDLLADPEKYKRELDEQSRRERPDMTDAQREAEWQFIVQQFGL